MAIYLKFLSSNLRMARDDPGADAELKSMRGRVMGGARCASVSPGKWYNVMYFSIV